MTALTIKVGSKNQVKVSAVEEILQDYPHLKDAVVEGVEVSSGISDQPMTLEEIVDGARNRAIGAFIDCTYSFGIESGLMAVPHTKSGYMDICVAAVHDGSDTHLGMSSGWEFTDPEITRLIVEDGLNMAEAVNKVGLTDNPAIGSQEGAIGIVTKGRLDRKGYTKQALQMALIHIDK
jgi:inosine/xanthosine triphosphatase